MVVFFYPQSSSHHPKLFLPKSPLHNHGLNTQTNGRSGGDKPLEDVKINKITIEE